MSMEMENGRSGLIRPQGIRMTFIPRAEVPDACVLR